MGMDVYGVKNPDAYFRASVWSWRPLNYLMRGIEAITDEQYENMGYNDGYAVDEEQCKDIKIKLQAWLDKHPNLDSFGLTLDNSETCEGELLNVLGFCHDSYTLYRDRLKVFIEFLDTCGGFRVW